MKYAEILNGRVRVIGESDFLPIFSKDSGLVAVECDDKVKEYWLYDGKKFTEAEKPVSVIVKDDMTKIKDALKSIAAKVGATVDL